MISRRSLLLFGACAALLAAPAALAADRRAFDRASFDAAVAAGGPVLVDVFAPWCTTCKAQSRALDALFKEPDFAGYKVFVVDYDSEKDVMRSFGATQRSTLIVYGDGAERGRVVGDTRRTSIEALLKAGL